MLYTLTLTPFQPPNVCQLMNIYSWSASTLVVWNIPYMDPVSTTPYGKDKYVFRIEIQIEVTCSISFLLTSHIGHVDEPCGSVSPYPAVWWTYVRLCRLGYGKCFSSRHSLFSCVYFYIFVLAASHCSHSSWAPHPKHALGPGRWSLSCRPRSTNHLP